MIREPGAPQLQMICLPPGAESPCSSNKSGGYGGDLVIPDARVRAVKAQGVADSTIFPGKPITIPGVQDPFYFSFIESIITLSVHRTTN